MSTIGIALYYLFDILSWIIVIKSFMTWLPSGGGIRSVMYKYTNGPVDFSPMVAILALMLLKNVALRVFI